MLLFLSLILSFQLSFAAEQKNYCNDSKSWQGWEALIEKYPNDEDVQLLHALRIGFCAKIEQGSITFEMANDLFNRAHELIIEKKLVERKQPQKDL
jgi:hypothetical protein